MKLNFHGSMKIKYYAKIPCHESFMVQGSSSNMSPYSLVSSLSEHTGWIVNVHLQDGINGYIISTRYALDVHTQATLYSIILMHSITGDVKYWDPRFTKAVKTLSTSLQINACDIHNYVPLLAW